MLKGLTYDKGLPAGSKEIEMIEHARLKRELENNMLPFTDEACFGIRKKMMEAQELREFKLREGEVEAQRDLRLATLKRALDERDENSEFLASQRIEAIRQSRMDVREKTMKKIRKKRIDILRKVARKRNTIDPSLSTSGKRDVINDYFDRASDVYAPLKREGRVVPAESKKFDTTVRAAPLNVSANIEYLEASIPKQFTGATLKAPSAYGADGRDQALMSKTAPLVGNGGGRAAMHRLTSAAHRSIRNTKRDIETMHVILTKNRLKRTGEVQMSVEESGAAGSNNNNNADSNVEGNMASKSLLLNRKPKGRPRTPNITNIDREENENLPLYAAITLLQRLVRGRAVQNSMFEGRHRRSELIAELRSSTEYEATLTEEPEVSQSLAEQKWQENIETVKQTTVDTVAGAISSNFLVLLAQEKVGSRKLLFFFKRRTDVYLLMIILLFYTA